jgi:chorismate dehydratase
VIRVSVIPYVNAMPLTYCLSEVCADASIVHAMPSKSLALLDSAQVDVALVPIADILDREDIHVFDGLGICAHGAVRSVLMQSQMPAQSVRSIQTDPASRTSNCLAQILCAFHWQTRPTFVESNDRADARIIIGDRALKTEHPAYCYDLSEQWNGMTQLPFVFAVWACQRNYHEIDRLTGMLRHALRLGLKARKRLAAEAAGHTGLSYDICYHYLSECVYYHVGPNERKAVQVFKGYVKQLSQGKSNGTPSSGSLAQGDIKYARVS